MHPDLEDFDAILAETRKVERWMARGIAVLVVVLSVAWLTQAWAAPRAKSGAECQAFWDVSLVARALALTGHDAEATAAVLAQVYDFSAAGPERERIDGIVEAIVRASQASRTPTASAFAASLHQACVMDAGNMDSVLGGPLT